jgi:4-amino-4-deoxy-L-arabinose transferase-like glycosyltransferase
MSPPPSPSGEAATPQASLGLRTLAVLTGAVLVFHGVVAGLIHLTEDEAYYRIWSLSPAAGYFDHPPMIAWWIWLGRHIGGDDAFGVRLLPVLASAITSFLVFDMARLVGASERAAARAGIWYNATLLAAAGAMLAIPDAPASLFWQTTAWCVLKAFQGRRVFAWWIAAGVAAGLATLSKYSGLFLAPGVFLLLVATERGRAQLKSPGPWLAMVIAAALFGVNLQWNATHHWLSFTKQFGRVAPHSLSPQFLFEFIVGQFVLLNPVVAVFAARAFAAKPRWLNLEGPWVFAALSLPFVLYLLIHSLHDRVQAHWPSPLYPGLAVAAALAAERIDARGWWARLRTLAPYLGLGVASAALIYGALPLPSGKGDPAVAVRGWPEFGRRLEALRLQRGAAWVGTLSYGQAAQLAVTPQLTAPVIEIGERDRYAILAHPPTADLSKPGLVVDLKRRTSIAALGACFSDVTAVGEVDRTPDRHAQYEVFLVARPNRVVEGGCWSGDRG